MRYTRPVQAVRALAITYIDLHVAAKQGNCKALHGRRFMRIKEPLGIIVSLDLASIQGQLEGPLTVWIA